ncbi:MAG: hypothetical protein ACP6KW_02650 [Candidatus Thorarchaeota archaeon]
MASEDKIRTEEPEEREEPEKKGLFRPLPETEKRFSKGQGRPQPVVRLLGKEMYEKTRDNILLILMPLLVALINTAIYSAVTVRVLESSSTYLFFIPAVIALPIGLTAADTGKALIGGFLASIFFIVFYILFLSSPALVTPELGLISFLLSAVALSMVYFVMMILATLLGSVVGTILKEFL